MSEIDELKEIIEKAKNCLICACIADPLDVIENTLYILKGDDRDLKEYFSKYCSKCGHKTLSGPSECESCGYCNNETVK